MFKVGDEVVITSDKYNRYDYTKIGSYGVVVTEEKYGYIRILFTFINNVSWDKREYQFSIRVEDISMKDRLTSITRKIRRIYERQHRKTGYAFLL